MDITIRPFAAGELDGLALLAQRLNASRQTGSSFCCSRAEDIRRDFEESMEWGFACWTDGRLVGLVSCFPDWEKGNADCSLLLDAHGADYRAAAGALLAKAREKLGSGMACTFFFPVENGECRSFLEQAGAQRQVNEYILRLERTAWSAPQAQAAEPRPVEEGEKAAFAALHDAVFPGAYASGRDILADLGKNRFIYVSSDGAGLAAYGVLKRQSEKQAAAEILAVRRDARRQGLGRTMLNHLAREAFSRLGAERLELVVEADNRGALRLYLDTGFQIFQENSCYILR